MTTNEMAVARYKIAVLLQKVSESLMDPNTDFGNVCAAIDNLDYAAHILEEIRHSAFPEWFTKPESEASE